MAKEGSLYKLTPFEKSAVLNKRQSNLLKALAGAKTKKERLAIIRAHRNKYGKK